MGVLDRKKREGLSVTFGEGDGEIVFRAWPMEATDDLTGPERYEQLLKPYRAEDGEELDDETAQAGVKAVLSLLEIIDETGTARPLTGGEITRIMDQKSGEWTDMDRGRLVQAVRTVNETSRGRLGKASETTRSGSKPSKQPDTGG